MTSRRQAYVPGDHLVVCDRTGFRVLASEARKEWTGAIVRGRSWEPRHPQDFVRAKADQQAVANARPVAPEQFLNTLTSLTAAAAVGATSLTVDSTSGFTSGHTVMVILDDGTVHMATAVVASTTSLTLGAPLPGAAAAGAVVRPLGYAATPEFDPALQRMPVKPSDAREALYRTMVNSLVVDGVWARLDALWVMAAHDQGAAVLNLKDPGWSFNLKPVGTVPFTADRGFTGSGVGGTYLLAGIPASRLRLYAQDDASMGVWDATAADSSGKVRITISGANASYVITNNATNVTTRANDSTTTQYVAGAAAGLWGWSRQSAASYVLYKNGLAVQTNAVASTTAPSTSLPLTVAGNTSDSPTDRLTAAYVGGGMSAALNLALYNALNTFLSAIGAV